MSTDPRVSQHMLVSKPRCQRGALAMTHFHALTGAAAAAGQMCRSAEVLEALEAWVGEIAARAQAKVPHLVSEELTCVITEVDLPQRMWLVTTIARRQGMYFLDLWTREDLAPFHFATQRLRLRFIGIQEAVRDVPPPAR